MAEHRWGIWHLGGVVQQKPGGVSQDGQRRKRRIHVALHVAHPPVDEPGHQLGASDPRRAGHQFRQPGRRPVKAMELAHDVDDLLGGPAAAGLGLPDGPVVQLGEVGEVGVHMGHGEERLPDQLGVVARPPQLGHRDARRGGGLMHGHLLVHVVGVDGAVGGRPLDHHPLAVVEVHSEHVPGEPAGASLHPEHPAAEPVGQGGGLLGGERGHWRVTNSIRTPSGSRTANARIDDRPTFSVPGGPSMSTPAADSRS